MGGGGVGVVAGLDMVLRHRSGRVREECRGLSQAAQLVVRSQAVRLGLLLGLLQAVRLLQVYGIQCIRTKEHEYCCTLNVCESS